MQIVDLFYQLARQHRRLNGFYYGKSYEKGAANEAHPLLWLDDPIYGQRVRQTLVYTCNVDILGIPKDDSDVPAVQAAAFEVGLSLAEQIEKTRPVTGFHVDGFSFTSLRDYYDNAAAGYRFTYTVVHVNPVDRCADDFDPNKEFSKASPLPDFTVETPEGCAVFADKPGLPNFKLAGDE